MSIEELGNKHFGIWDEIGVGNPQVKQHTKLSIEFAISVLNDIFQDGCGEIYYGSSDDFIEEYKDKIEELKKQLL